MVLSSVHYDGKGQVVLMLLLRIWAESLWVSQFYSTLATFSLDGYFYKLIQLKDMDILNITFIKSSSHVINV